MGEFATADWNRNNNVIETRKTKPKVKI